MKTRIITGAVLVPVLIAVLVWAPKILVAVLLAVLCAIAAVELLHNTGMMKHPRLLSYAALTAALVPLWCHFGMHFVWGQLGLLLLFGLLFMEIMLSHVKLKFEKVSVCFTAALLIPYMLSALVRILGGDFGRYLVFIPFVAAFASDTGAYFIGSKFGKHKMAPVISPKKSVEGLFGGVACAILGMLLYALVLQLAFGLTVSYLSAALYGLIGSFVGVFGDLCFSVIKRQTGVKDYGNIFPGHGGVLDRFDSVLVVAPVMELLLILLPMVVKK